jgi:capsular polysaccharide biosynthesis protein
MLDIPTYFNSLIVLANFLFGDKLINSSNLNPNNLIKMNQVILIKNHTDMQYFMHYNNNIIKNTIREYYNDDTIEQYDNVFLTRSINTPHDQMSVIENLKDVEIFFSKHNFKIIDPSKTTDKIKECLELS